MESLKASKSMYDRDDDEDSRYHVRRTEFISLDTDDDESSSESVASSDSSASSDDGDEASSPDVKRDKSESSDEEKAHETVQLPKLPETSIISLEQSEQFDRMGTKEARGRYFTEDGDVTTAGTRRTKCYYCRKVGHLAKECQVKILGADVCPYCDEPHDPTMCPFASEVCYLCGHMGPIRRDCPNRDRPDMIGPRDCLSCRARDHTTLECTAIWRQYRLDTDQKHAKPSSRITKFCYHCGTAGHFGDDCPHRHYSRIHFPSVFTTSIFDRVAVGRSAAIGQNPRQYDKHNKRKRSFSPPAESDAKRQRHDPAPQYRPASSNAMAPRPSSFKQSAPYPSTFRFHRPPLKSSPSNLPSSLPTRPHSTPPSRQNGAYGAYGGQAGPGRHNGPSPGRPIGLNPPPASFQPSTRPPWQKNGPRPPDRPIAQPKRNRK